jgi:putative hydrolase of the HAD superfamily
MPATRDKAEALLLDLDGVLRVFDPSVATLAEQRYGLPAGTIVKAAFEWSRLRPALVGEQSHDEWMAATAGAIAEVAGDLKAATAAVAEWQSYRGDVAPAVLAFIRSMRSAGVRVGIATNATSLLDDDLATHGLARELDVVVNSSKIGIHKPAPEFFAQACAALGYPPRSVLFVDDEDRNVQAARAAGLAAHRWTGPGDLSYVQAALGR